MIKLVYLRQKQLLEDNKMTTLFPTFTNWLQQTKRFFATDSHTIWERIYEFIEEDEAQYQQRLQAKGIDFVV